MAVDTEDTSNTALQKALRKIDSDVPPAVARLCRSTAPQIDAAEALAREARAVRNTRRPPTRRILPPSAKSDPGEALSDEAQEITERFATIRSVNPPPAQK